MKTDNYKRCSLHTNIALYSYIYSICKEEIKFIPLHHCCGQLKKMRIISQILTTLALIAYACITYAQVNIEQEISILKDQIEQGDSTSEIHNQLGELYYNQYTNYMGEGYMSIKLDKSIANFKKAIRLNPNNDMAYFNLGIAYSPKGIADPTHNKYDSAIYYLEKAIKLNIPEKKVAYFSLGLTYFTQYQSQLFSKEHSELIGGFHKSIHYYLDAIELDSNYWLVYNNLGHHYRQKYAKDYLPESIDSSIYYYEKSVSINPNDYMIYNLLAKKYEMIEDYDNTIRNFEKSVNLNINSDAAYYLILYYQYKKQYEKAIETYEKLLPEPPIRGFVNIYAILSDIYSKVGDTLNAEKYYKIHTDFKY